MSDPAESAAPEWRIVQVVPVDESNVLSVATARVLNDNSPSSKRLLARLEAFVSQLLQARREGAGRRSRARGGAGHRQAEGLSETVPRLC